MNNLNKKGFIALTLVITIASLLLAFSYTQSIETAIFFDQTRLKEYRQINFYNAYSCIDQAILNISHDYFYKVSSPVELPDFHCVIDSVEEKNGQKVIKTHGNFKGINVKREQVLNLY